MYMTLVVQSSTNSNKRMITTKISFLVRLNKVKWTNSCSIYKETDFSTVRLVCLYFTMVSVSSLFFSGIVLIAGVSAVPKAEVQSLQKMEHYKKMVESNFEIQPRGCTDLCCSGPASCCRVNGCTWTDNRCRC